MEVDVIALLLKVAPTSLKASGEGAESSVSCVGIRDANRRVRA